jgi:acetyl esterase/lipase
VRKTCIAVVAALSILPGSVGAQVQVSDKVVTVDAYPERRATFPGGVTGLPDLTYVTINGYRRLTLDLYLPSDSPATRHPAVIYIHGGGWAGGSPRNAGAFENWPAVLASIAARGYVVASIEYRFGREAPYPAALHDTKNAIRWLRTNAAKFGVESDRILAWGASAGGELAGLAATTCGVTELEAPITGGRGRPEGAMSPAPAPSDCVQAAVLWYAASDLEAAANPPPGSADARGGAQRGGGGGPRDYLGCTPPNCGAQAKAASVGTYVKEGGPPILLIHGEADHTVPVLQSQRLYEQLQAKGVRSELLVFPEIDHSFIGKTPDATRDASRKALDKTIAFIDATIGPKSR